MVVVTIVAVVIRIIGEERSNISKMFQETVRGIDQGTDQGRMSGMIAIDLGIDIRV